MNRADSINTEIFKHLFAAIAEEMGVLLRKSSYSPNIKERRDYSCAVFNHRGQMIAQAAHIPVHLGSMPIASEIYQEGLIIPPVKLFEGGRANQAVFDLLFANVRTPEERSGDLWAQIAANRRGAQRLEEMARRYGLEELHRTMQEQIAYAARLTRTLLAQLPDGEYHFADELDDNGIEKQPVPIQVKVLIQGQQARVDFSGSAPQQAGSINAVRAITLSAVYYVFRCLIGLDAPNNAGCLEPIEVITPVGSVVNAQRPAPVAGGNVETSQRIVDVLLGALAQACPERVPAASQGTMNNLTIGGRDPRTGQPFAYYETIGGGIGAGSRHPGPSAMHSHMTNTLNTPVEALEYAYPLRVHCYAIRRGSGGAGRQPGGDGIIRSIELLCPASVTLLSERRNRPPYGLNGGSAASTGQNRLLQNGESRLLPGKGSFELPAGAVLEIRTPGGGGWGKPDPETNPV